jgi:hypothetical protein
VVSFKQLYDLPRVASRARSVLGAAT